MFSAASASDRELLEAETNVFWTTATRAGCPGQWTECVVQANEVIVARTLDVLGSDGACLSMCFAGGTVLGARSAPCSTQYQLVCYADTELPFEPPINSKVLDSGSSACNYPNEPERRCEKANVKFYEKPQSDSYGQWSNSTASAFLFSKIKATWLDAKCICDDLKMDLVPIENIGKHNSLQDHILYKMKLKQNEFWTSGLKSENCPGEFIWSTNVDFVRKKDMLWAKNRDESKPCLFLQAQQANAIGAMELRLNGDSCDATKYFICEKKLYQLSSYSGVIDCISLNQLKQKYVDKFLTDPVDKFSYAMKKTMQCIAENFGFVNSKNKVVTKQIIRYIIEISDLLKPDNLLKNLNGKSLTFEDFDQSVGKFGSRKVRNYKKNAEFHWRNTLKLERFELVSKLMVTLQTCKKQLAKYAGDVFAYEFYKCIVRESNSLQRFWTFFDLQSLKIEKDKLADFDKATATYVEHVREWGSCSFQTPYFKMYDSYRDFCKTSPFLDHTQFKLQDPYPYKLAPVVKIDYCIKSCGSLPFASTKEEFDQLYAEIVARTDSSESQILWNSAFRAADGTLRWCCPFCPEGSVPVPMPVQGVTDAGPFLLVSDLSPTPNLKAIPPTKFGSMHISCRVKLRKDKSG